MRNAMSVEGRYLFSTFGFGYVLRLTLVSRPLSRNELVQGTVRLPLAVGTAIWNGDLIRNKYLGASHRSGLAEEQSM